MTAFLSLKDVTKVYPGGTRALDGISLDVERGQFVVLIGLSVVVILAIEKFLGFEKHFQL